MTTPAWKPWVRARKATAGVGMTPALSTRAPAARRPAARVAAIQGLDSRVSRPSRTRARRQVLRSEWREGETDGEDGGGVEGGFAGDGADAVGAEEFA